MNNVVRATGPLAALSFAMTFASPSSVAGNVRPYAEGAMGIQLEQPAADAQRVGAILQAVVVASDRFNSFGFVGTQVGDKASVTVLVAGQKWTVKNQRTGTVQTVGLVNQKLVAVPTGFVNQQPALAPIRPVNQKLAVAPAGPVNPQLVAAPTVSASQNHAVAPAPASTASPASAPIIASATFDGADIVVAWWGVKGAVTFEVFRTADPALPATRVAQLSSTSLGYRDKGAGTGPFYYQVVAVEADGTRMASAWFPLPAR